MLRKEVSLGFADGRLRRTTHGVQVARHQDGLDACHRGEACIPCSLRPEAGEHQTTHFGFRLSLVRSIVGCQSRRSFLR